MKLRTLLDFKKTRLKILQFKASLVQLEELEKLYLSNHDSKDDFFFFFLIKKKITKWRK